MTFPRLRMAWSGGAFQPASRFWADVARKNLDEGSEHWVSESKERSGKSHNHYFATISEGWAQLPEHIAQRFPGKEGPECLRKYCLIKAGYCHMSEHPFDTPEDAARAAMMADDRTNPDRYTITRVTGCVVQKFIAETQRQKDMGNARFQESKSAVLEIISGMIGISVEELAANVEKSA